MHAGLCLAAADTAACVPADFHHNLLHPVLCHNSKPSQGLQLDQTGLWQHNTARDHALHSRTAAGLHTGEPAPCACDVLLQSYKQLDIDISNEIWRAPVAASCLGGLLVLLFNILSCGILIK